METLAEAQERARQKRERAITEVPSRSLTHPDHQDVELRAVARDPVDGTWHQQASNGNLFGTFETRDEAEAAVRSHALSRLTGPVGRDEYEALAETLDLDTLTDEEIEDRSYQIRHAPQTMDDVTHLAALRLKAIREA